ncbi:hypothetical protein ECHSTV_0770 [Ehrlichia chaffeensis str. Saint Vincent]|nr:hypothetical protein ECHSTV_0770 [Ehrlichia chaffeensis str. Saint Vincent]
MYESCDIVEYASNFFRLVCLIAVKDANIIVIPEIYIIILLCSWTSVFNFSNPIMYNRILIMVNTPDFTTATACNNALTGVGATMACGNHKCVGINAAFPIP